MIYWRDAMFVGDVVLEVNHGWRRCAMKFLEPANDSFVSDDERDIARGLRQHFLRGNFRALHTDLYCKEYTKVSTKRPTR